MLGLLRHLHHGPTFTFHLTVYKKSISPTYAHFWSMAAHLLPVLSVRSARQLEAVQQKALSICSVDSACISSLSERCSSILLRLFFSILDDNVPDHLSSFCQWSFVHTATTRTPRNSFAIDDSPPTPSHIPVSVIMHTCRSLSLITTGRYLG